MTSLKTIIAGQYRVTIKLFDSQTALNNFLNQLIAKGYKSASEEGQGLNIESYESALQELNTEGYKYQSDGKAQDKTYHLCFNECGVIYYDLV